MKLKFYCFIALSLVFVSALSAKNGVTINANIISGKIVGEANDFLPGANVRLKDQNIYSITNANGEFKLYNVKNGGYEIIVSYMGYKTYSAKLFVTGSMDLGAITLLPLVTTIGEVVVSSSIEGQQKAYNQQKNADNIKNIVSSDLIGRFPDLNVAEALQRVSGVSIQRDNGEGSIIQIRGTPLNYTTIAVNGEQIPSTDEGGNRSESLDLISADQLSSMEITKALTPDMDGDATGGAVNLITPTAKSGKWSTKGTIGGGYNTLFNRGSGTFKYNADKRFYKEKLGVLIGGSYYNTVNGEERSELIYGKTNYNDGRGDVLEINDFRLRPLLNTRKRITITSTIDYKFNANSKIFFNALYSNLNDASLRNAVRIRPRAGTYTTPTTAAGNNVEIRRELNDREIDKKNLTLNFGGKHFLNSLGTLLDYDGFYTKSERNLTSIRTNFRRRNFTLNVDRSNTDLPILTSPNFNFEDYSQYTFLSREHDNAIVNTGENMVAKFNLTKPIKINDLNIELKAGSKLRTLSNERRRNTTIHDQIRGVYTLDQVLGDYNTTIFDTYNLGFTPNGNATETYFRDNFNAFVANKNQETGVNDAFYFNANEEVTANYFQGKINYKKWMFLAGVRHEKTNVEYDAIRIDRTPSGLWQKSTPISGKNTFKYFLPMLHVKYALSENSNFRFAATKTYSRPNFDQIVPTQDVNAFELRIVSGNSNLVPSTATNIDLMYENYFKNSGVFSGGFFYKKIDGFIFTQVSNVVGGQFDGFVSTTPINGDVANIYGLELNYSYKFINLPGFLSGLGTFVNYTYAQSESNTAERKNVKFEGQADHLWNAALSYDKKKFNIRATMNYNGAFITALSNDEFNDFYTAARYQLDMNASYKLNKKFTIFSEFVNLTNSKKVEYQYQRNNPNNIESYGWSTRFGLNFKL